jgi:glycosyltransferase involved in cell wall biosynthesis
MSRPVDVSVLVPANNEADNLAEFMRLAAEALGPASFTFEVVVVYDGSRDGTGEVLGQLQSTYPWLRVVTHRRQRGIADALRSASEAAAGEIMVFYPADLQYLPADIPSLLQPILEGQADIVTGTKQGKYEKAFVSGIYNALCRRLFGVQVQDLNSVKAWRREIMRSVPLRPDWHRYMVVIAAADGWRLTSRPVPLYPRRAGISKFNWKRIPVGVLDLLSVWFQLRFGRKPMLFFGVLGAALFAVGFLARHSVMTL